MSDAKDVNVKVSGSSAFDWFFVLMILFMLSDRDCGGGWHWTYDGQPHSFVIEDAPKATKP